MCLGYCQGLVDTCPVASDNNRERHCAVPQGTLPALIMQAVGVLFTLHITVTKYRKTSREDGFILTQDHLGGESLLEFMVAQTQGRDASHLSGSGDTKGWL